MSLVLEHGRRVRRMPRRWQQRPTRLEEIPHRVCIDLRLLVHGRVPHTHQRARESLGDVEVQSVWMQAGIADLCGEDGLDDTSDQSSRPSAALTPLQKTATIE